MEPINVMTTAISSWPEFNPTSHLANATYMVTGNYSINSISMKENVTLIFSGGRITGSGTFTGRNTTFVAPPIQVFDATVKFAGTWKMEKVYAENFGDTNGTNAHAAINRALEFSNASGCKVQLLGKKYAISSPIIIRGNTVLEGTIMGASLASDSVPSQHGTVIEASGQNDAINIETNGTAGDIDCLRFSLNNFTIRHLGTGIAIKIFSTNTDTTVRSAFISNIKIKHIADNEVTKHKGGYGIHVDGGSYIKFDHIYINNGCGVIVTGSKMTEFLWFDKVILNGVNTTSFEITKGNNIYLTEVDTNDSKTGLLISNQTGGTFNVFVNRLNSARCVKGIHIKSHNGYITRIKVSEATIYQTKEGEAALYFDRANANYFIGECLFENIHVDTSDAPSDFYSIKEIDNCLDKCQFINIRAGKKTQLRDNNCRLTFTGIKQGGVYTANAGTTVCSIPLTSNSPFPRKPAAIVSTNQTIPYRVETTHQQGGNSSIVVTFASAPTSKIVISYYLTGYYFSD